MIRNPLSCKRTVQSSPSPHFQTPTIPQVLSLEDPSYRRSTGPAPLSGRAMCHGSGAEAVPVLNRDLRPLLVSGCSSILSLYLKNDIMRTGAWDKNTGGAEQPPTCRGLHAKELKNKLSSLTLKCGGSLLPQCNLVGAN